VQRASVRIQVPAGIGWSQISIEYVDDDVVAIRVADQPPVRLSSAELGLTKDPNGSQNLQWRLLLALCEGAGRCTRSATGAPNMDVLKKRAERLGDALCAVFGLPDRPLHINSREQLVWSDFCAAPETRREASRRKA
jgi:hypothetical protein